MQGFDALNPPFDRLTNQEIEQLKASLDIGYFRRGEVIVQQGRPSEFLHVIIKGAVEDRAGDTLQAVLGPKDSFDARAVIHGAAGEDFIAAEETLCHRIPQPIVQNLIRRNPAFAAFFYFEVSRKLDAFVEQPRWEGVETVLRARVRDARHGAAVFIEGAATIEDAGHYMRDNDINPFFVRGGDRVGVVTGMNLSKAVVLKRLPLDTPIRNLCPFDVTAVGLDDFVFDALLLMTRYNRRRLAIQSNGGYIGFLEDIDILGLFAGNSQLIPGRIDRARSLDDLTAPAHDIQAQVERLHRQSVKVEVIAEITSHLNARLFVKLFDLVAPPSIRESGCLMLMGSEGRSEQTVRTDQDNGILLAGEVLEADLEAFREAFSGALDSFGFPPCPGDVMVRNPVWSQPVDGFVRQLRSWVLARDPDAAMNLAIFSDATAVTGRSDLLAAARTALIDLLRGEAALLARFASLIETFNTPRVGRLSSIMASVGFCTDAVAVKNAGTSPLVPGLRTLALDKGILAHTTANRVEALVAAGSLEPAFGRELVSALRVFMEFRLRSQLQARRRGTMEGESLVRLNEITTADRDILRAALRIVRQFRAIIRIRYPLGAF